MRVLHVINSLILAGVEVLLAEMLPIFRERGLDNKIALLKPLHGPLEQRLQDNGFAFVAGLPEQVYSPLHVRKLAQQMPEYDLVMAYLFPAQLWVAAASMIAKRSVPLVTTEQNTTNRRRMALLRPLDRWMYSRYAAIICNSPATHRELLQWVPPAKDRTVVVANGVPVKRISEAAPASKREVTGSDSAPVVLFSARFQPQKDHATVLRAVAKVPVVHLALAGDGELRPEMEVLAERLGIRARVHFLGRRADIPSLLKMADLYVHSSISEGFGIAVAEALAAGLPVIASDVPGLNEVVAGGGILFQTGDVDSLAGHISRLLQSRELRAEWGKKASARGREFSIERTAEAYIRVFECVLARKPLSSEQSPWPT